MLRSVFYGKVNCVQLISFKIYLLSFKAMMCFYNLCISSVKIR